MPTRKHFIK